MATVRKTRNSMTIQEQEYQKINSSRLALPIYGFSANLIIKASLPIYIHVYNGTIYTPCTYI